jgi:hypothetical protein
MSIIRFSTEEWKTYPNCKDIDYYVISKTKDVELIGCLILKKPDGELNFFTSKSRMKNEKTEEMSEENKY